ncbi:NAD(P)-dependent oxidoreductase [Ectothiorhodospiraceae bacterium 2226]|nr:NAD(P)-dependent oxidoreductase [Ectothiorhodospiraceae bacterium 2226]
MRVAVLGTGLMGAPLARRLLHAGHEVCVYNRTAARARDLGAAGATVCGRPLEAVREADCAILMLTDAAAVRDCLLSEPGSDALRGRTLIQMGTVGPGESRDLAIDFEQAGAYYLEAPVLGSIPEARDGTLIVMVGATRALYAQWKPLLSTFGPEPRHIGEVGHAAALKLSLNQLIAGLTASFALSLRFVQREGVSVDTFMEVLRGSALYAPTFDKKLNRILNRDFTNPNFPTRHLLKDVDLFRRAAAGSGLGTAGLDGVRTLLLDALERGLGDEDYSALAEALEPPPGR